MGQTGRCRRAADTPKRARATRPHANRHVKLMSEVGAAFLPPAKAHTMRRYKCGRRMASTLQVNGRVQRALTLLFEFLDFRFDSGIVWIQLSGCFEFGLSFLLVGA